MVVELKCVIIGDAGTGKTSITSRFALGEAPQNPASTVGASFLQKRLRTSAGMECCLQLWDTAGQERFRAMAPMYYRGAKAAVIVVDSTLPDCTKKTESWLEDLKQFADADCVVSLAINKVDLLPPSANSDVNYDALKPLLTSNNIPVFKTSAITGEGVTNLFSDLAVRAQEAESAASASAAEMIGVHQDRKKRSNSGSSSGSNNGADGDVIDLADLDDIGAGGSGGGVCC